MPLRPGITPALHRDYRYPLLLSDRLTARTDSKHTLARPRGFRRARRSRSRRIVATLQDRRCHRGYSG